jgi:hypothetical protein
MPPPDRIPHFPCFIKMCPDHFLNVYRIERRWTG